MSTRRPSALAPSLFAAAIALLPAAALARPFGAPPVAPRVEVPAPIAPPAFPAPYGYGPQAVPYAQPGPRAGRDFARASRRAEIDRLRFESRRLITHGEQLRARASQLRAIGRFPAARRLQRDADALIAQGLDLDRRADAMFATMGPFGGRGGYDAPRPYAPPRGDRG